MNLLLLLVNGSLMAGIYAFAKAGGLPPLALLAWQLLTAALVVTAVAAWRGELPAPTRPALRYAAIAGTLGISAPSLVTFSALAHVPAGLVGVIGALSPLFTYGLALLWRIERPVAMRAAGIAVGFAGVVALLWPSAGGTAAASLPWALLALAGPLLLAGGNLFRTLAWPPGLPPLAAASLMLGVQAAFVVPLALLLGVFEAPSPPAGRDDVALLGAGTLTSLFYLTAFELQRRAGPVLVGQLGYVITAASLLIGALVFDERYPAFAWLAIATVLAGPLLVHHGGRAAALSPSRQEAAR